MTMRPSTEIAAEIAAVEAQRVNLATGQAVVDVWRDGRRMRLAIPSLAELETLLATLRREYEAAVLAESGGTARRGIRLQWG